MTLIQIASPLNGTHVPVGVPVTFVGTATGGIQHVVLTADAEFDLGKVPVDANGHWSLTRAFSVAHLRTITVTGFTDAGTALETDALTLVITPATATCTPRVVQFTVVDKETQKSTGVFSLSGTNALFFVSGMTICADGSPRAYCPENKGLDDLGNARRKDGSLSSDVLVFSHGTPVVGANGCYISKTALIDASRDEADPTRYVDSEVIPYFVMPGLSKVAKNGLVPGDFGAVFYGPTQKLAFVVYGDVGPGDHIGEGSIALAQQLGFTKQQQNARTGGVPDQVLYVAFPGSRLDPRWSAARTSDDIAHHASPLFEQWGGLTRLKVCFGDLA